MIVGAELLADLLAQEAAHRLVGDAADHLAEQVADVDRVIGAEGARLPGGLLLLQCLDMFVPAEPGAGRGAVAIDDAAGVREDMADQHALLAGLREFRPVVGDGRIEIDFAAVDEDVHAQRTHAFGDRVHDDDGVFSAMAPCARGPCGRPTGRRPSCRPCRRRRRRRLRRGGGNCRRRSRARRRIPARRCR